MIYKGENMKRIILIVSTLITLILLFTINVSPVSAYSYSTGKHWEYGWCTYNDTSLPSDWQTEIETAASTWNGASSPFTFYWEPYVYDNEVLAQYWGGAYALAWGFTAADGNYHIYEAEIMFNTYYPYSTSGGFMTIDVQSIALHEFGHWLVLDDLDGLFNMDKVMYYQWIYVVKHSLTNDDANGISAIYP
jgi:hypothetical protein